MSMQSFHLSVYLYFTLCLNATIPVHQCLNGLAPPYLSEHCIPVSSADTRRHLRSANRHLLAVSRFRLNTYGRRAFSVAGPMAWNSLPDFIRDPTSNTDGFKRLLNGPITIAIRARFEYDSTTIRLQHATTRYEVFRALAYEIVYENQW